MNIGGISLEQRQEEEGQPASWAGLSWEKAAGRIGPDMEKASFVDHTSTIQASLMFHQHHFNILTSPPSFHTFSSLSSPFSSSHSFSSPFPSPNPTQFAYPLSLLSSSLLLSSLLLPSLARRPTTSHTTPPYSIHPIPVYLFNSSILLFKSSFPSTGGKSCPSLTI